MIKAISGCPQASTFVDVPKYCFQMVGLIHNPNYENDPGIFPTYLVGNVIGGLQGQGGHVTVKEGVKVNPAAVGRGQGEASLFHLHVDHET